MRELRTKRREKLDLREALNRSPRPGYLSFKICTSLVDRVNLKNEIRCYGVLEQGGLPSGSGVVASDIFTEKECKLVLFSIESLVQKDYFSAETEELVIQVDGREVFRKQINFCTSMFFG